MRPSPRPGSYRLNEGGEVGEGTVEAMLALFLLLLLGVRASVVLAMDGMMVR